MNSEWPFLTGLRILTSFQFPLDRSRNHKWAVQFSVNNLSGPSSMSNIRKERLKVVWISSFPSTIIFHNRRREEERELVESRQSPLPVSIAGRGSRNRRQIQADRFSQFGKKIIGEVIVLVAMVNAMVALLVTILVVADVQSASALPSTVPAFLWSSHHHEFSSEGMKDAVNYQTISPKDLAKSVMSEGGWANLLCLEKKVQQCIDVALVFVGRELLSSDVSGNKYTDAALLDLLKVFYERSNFSLAFPYVAAAGEQTMENILFSGFMETCGWDSAINKVAFSESCSVDGENLQKLADPGSVHHFLVSNMERGSHEQANLVVFCHGGSRPGLGPSQPKAESEILSEVISSVEQSGAKYAVLYVSDSLRSIQYPTHQELERFLAEDVQGNGSLDSKVCDEVCQIKSSLLEGLLVAIVLLIILISGLCCMMGIDTPTRFEAPQES